jgi:hypothetical protein
MPGRPPARISAQTEEDGVRRFLAAGVGCALMGMLASTAHGSVSPVGLWKAENGRTYRWAMLPGGVYGEYAMTSHRTSSHRCLVRPNTLVYRYHPLGAGRFAVDSFRWEAGCVTHWSLRDETIRITFTSKRMTESCDKQYSKVCWTYARAGDVRAPTVHALGSSGKVGGATALRYLVRDDSGRTREALTIYRGAVVARRYRTTLGPAKAGHVYAYRLGRTPATFRGTFRFCVVSTDAAGNTSKPSCEKVSIR